jgi:hypothetical protein
MGIWTRMITVSETTTPFKFTVQTTTANQVFTLPIYDYGTFTPNIGVDWGDGNISTITSSTSALRAHTYVLAGTYTITINGFCPAFLVNNTASIRTVIKSIIQWGDVGFKQINFYGCSALTSIPGGYKGLANIENFSNFMHSTGVTTIPSDIFTYSTIASVFSDIFSFTNVTSIPSGLFDSNLQAQTFNSAFNNCLLLVSYPSNLFDLNVNVVNFASTFKNCRKLTYPLQFGFNTQVTTYNNVYYMSTTTNALTGNAPTLWLSTTAYGVGAFHNCTGLTNYSSIPSNWI